MASKVFKSCTCHGIPPLKYFYSQFGERCLAAGQPSELLTFSGIGWNLDSLYDLPLWVPDFQSLSTAEGGTSMLFEHRSGDGSFKANQGLLDTEWRVEDDDILHAYGIVGSSVTDVQPPISGWRGAYTSSVLPDLLRDHSSS